MTSAEPGKAGGVRAQRHQALRARRRTGRPDRRRRAHRECQRPEDGVSLFLVPRAHRGLTIKLLPTMDQTRKLCEVDVPGVEVGADALLGPRDAAWPPWRACSIAPPSRSAPRCAAAPRRVLDMTTEYAKIRIAFGKPIGTYQGVKHKAADMLVDVENAKSLTYYAAWAVDENAPEAPLAAVDGQGLRLRRLPEGRRAPASSSTAASASPGSTTCISTSSAPSRSEFTFGDATLSPRAGRSADKSCRWGASTGPPAPTLRAPAEPWRSASVVVRVVMGPRRGPPCPPRSAPRRSRGASRACSRWGVSPGPPEPPALRTPA